MAAFLLQEEIKKVILNKTAIPVRWLMKNAMEYGITVPGDGRRHWSF